MSAISDWTAKICHAAPLICVCLLPTTAWTEAQDPSELPASLDCTAEQTAGFHDYPHNPESYEAVAFFESEFTLDVNQTLTRHLAPENPVDVYMTLEKQDTTEELTCHYLRGAGNTRGISCSTVPPSAFLLLNIDTLRFTHTSIGGWAFHAATENTAGDSIYVEYGTCRIRG